MLSYANRAFQGSKLHSFPHARSNSIDMDTKLVHEQWFHLWKVSKNKLGSLSFIWFPSVSLIFSPIPIVCVFVRAFWIYPLCDCAVSSYTFETTLSTGCGIPFLQFQHMRDRGRKSGSPRSSPVTN